MRSSLSRTAVTLLLTAVALAGPALEAEPLGLTEVVALSLERNPGLKAIEERLVEVRAGVIEARAEALPQLDFTSSWGQSRNPSLLNSPDFEDLIDFLPGGFEPQTQELYGLALSVKQPIFTFGKVGAALRLAKLAVEAVDAQVATARLDTASRAAEAYFRLLGAQEALRAIEIQRQARQESLTVVRNRYELGDATRLELLQAEASLAQVEPQILGAQGLVEVAERDLRGVLDLSTGAEVVFSRELAALPDPPSSETAIRWALAQRPELTDLDRQRSALAEQKRVVLAGGKPQIELTGRYGRTARLPENLSDSLYEDWSFGIGLRWEFFDGFRRAGQGAQLESRREQLRLRAYDLESQIRLEVDQALTAYRTARASLAAAIAAADAAAEASRVARQNYEEGVALQIDWLGAQQREIEAEISRVQTEFDARVSAARISRALGRFPGLAWEPPPPGTPPENAPSAPDAVVEETP